MRAGARRTIASYVAPLALAPGTRASLEALGYRILLAATRGRFDDGSWPVDLRLVDERHLGRVPRDATPIVLLGAAREDAPPDPRVVGVARRPAAVGELYALMQRALEPCPRIAPRAPALLPALCSHGDRRWSAQLHTLSETGCGLRASADLPAGLVVDLSFPLGAGRPISSRARVIEGRAPDWTLAFRAPCSRTRVAIADYVRRRLATS